MTGIYRSGFSGALLLRLDQGPSLWAPTPDGPAHVFEHSVDRVSRSAICGVRRTRSWRPVGSEVPFCPACRRIRRFRLCQEAQP